MPLIVWAYSRGEAIEHKGWQGLFYAVHYAARTASEFGADVVKVIFPHPREASRLPAESLRFVDRLREILARYPTP
jgi:class I fructose-bisphosphate aldolase